MNPYQPISQINTAKTIAPMVIFSIQSELGYPKKVLGVS